MVAFANSRSALCSREHLCEFAHLQSTKSICIGKGELTFLHCSTNGVAAFEDVSYSSSNEASINSWIPGVKTQIVVILRKLACYTSHNQTSHLLAQLMAYLPCTSVDCWYRVGAYDLPVKLEYDFLAQVRCISARFHQALTLLILCHEVRSAFQQLSNIVQKQTAKLKRHTSGVPFGSICVRLDGERLTVASSSLEKSWNRQLQRALAKSCFILHQEQRPDGTPQRWIHFLSNTFFHYLACGGGTLVTQCFQGFAELCFTWMYLTKLFTGDSPAARLFLTFSRNPQYPIWRTCSHTLQAIAVEHCSAQNTV